MVGLDFGTTYSRFAYKNICSIDLWCEPLKKTNTVLKYNKLKKIFVGIIIYSFTFFTDFSLIMNNSLISVCIFFMAYLDYVNENDTSKPEYVAPVGIYRQLVRFYLK